MRHTARNLSVLGLGLSASAVVGWLLLRESKRDKAAVATFPAAGEPTEIPQIVLPLEPISEDTADSTSVSAFIEPENTAIVDDLTRINDIGPKFAEALNAIGITQFEQLAQQTPDGLAQKLTNHITVRAKRIQDKDWIGQASELAK